MTGPSREGEEVHGCKGIDTIHGQRDDEKEPKEEVREWRQAGLRLEIVEVLEMSRLVFVVA